VTVCISAICDGGKTIVFVSDGMISASVSADTRAYKLKTLGDWTFAFSGTYSNADLILQKAHQELGGDFKNIERARIQQIIWSTYRHRMSEWLADRLLSPYDMTMEEFKGSGLNTFGEKIFEEMSRAIDQNSIDFRESILFGGFATDHPLAVLYEASREGIVSHCTDGFAAIGSGGHIAETTLLLLEQSRYYPLEVTLYAVAAAKFSAENCDGVGKSTCMLVMRAGSSEKQQPDNSTTIIQPYQVEQMREIWEAHGKPKIPEEGLETLHTIAVQTGPTDNSLKHLRDWLSRHKKDR
jgi:hypothetical protein